MRGVQQARIYIGPANSRVSATWKDRRYVFSWRGQSRCAPVARSRVIRGSLRPQTAFSQEPDVKEVGVPVNCSAETFEIFLDGVYSCTLPDLRPTVHELILVLQLVDEYEVDSLRAECIAQLVSVDVRGAFTVLRAGLEKSFVPEAVTSKVRVRSASVRIQQRPIECFWDPRRT